MVSTTYRCSSAVSSGNMGRASTSRAALLRFRQVTLFVSQVREAFLQVQGQGIVHLGADAARREERSQFITAPGADDVLVEDVVCLGHGFEHAHGNERR